MLNCWGGRSAKFGVMVFKASMLDLGGRSAKFGVVVFKASMLDCRGEGRSAKFSVMYSRHLCSIGGTDLPADQG